MQQKIPDKTIKMMQKLYDNQVSIAEISRRVNVSYQTTWTYIKYKEKGFKSPGDYLEYSAKQRGFKSWSEYRKDWLKKKGFESRMDYEKDLAKREGFKSVNERNEHLAKQKKFASLTEYNKDLTKKRQQRRKNQRLGYLIKKRLNQLGKTQTWLAGELEVTKGAVSRYVSCEVLPRKNLHQKLFEILNVPYKTLDDLLE